VCLDHLFLNRCRPQLCPIVSDGPIPDGVSNTNKSAEEPGKVTTQTVAVEYDGVLSLRPDGSARFEGTKKGEGKSEQLYWDGMYEVTEHTLHLKPKKDAPRASQVNPQVLIQLWPFLELESPRINLAGKYQVIEAKGDTLLLLDDAGQSIRGRRIR